MSVPQPIREYLTLFDTTLRDGAQTTGVDFSLEDKRTIAAMLDDLGLDYIEGGYPGANPLDTAFFARKPALKARFAAFGMTKRAGRSAANDPRIAALLDADPKRVGEEIGGLVVRHVDDLDAVVRASNVAIGVIATPAAPAQDVCDRLVAAGVTSILNFAPTVLSVPEGVDLRKVDLSIELQILSFHEHRKSARPAGVSA